ncbi:putative uncharacterized protein FLJ44672, partial [Papio anubis]|uniref:putative uncharacterized protein FLJ44672 n=1 Tax=Papio anubis TaxID=9555 RepID=UPI0012AE77DE
MEIKYLINVIYLNLLAQVLPLDSLCNLSRPRTFSSRPLQTKLMTHNGLFRPIPYLTAVSADEATASQQPPQAQLHRYNGLCRPSSCFPVFSPGPELSQVDLTRPSSCLSLPSQGPAFASWWPHEAHLLTPGSLYRPSSCLTAPNVLKPGPTVASPGPAPALRRRLHAPDFLQPASPGPVPPPGGLCRPTLASSRALQGSLLLPAAPARPTRRP